MKRARKVIDTVGIGSLFSGIGGLEWGVEEGLREAGFRAGTLFQVERNPYSSAVLQKHWPAVPCFADVRGLRGADLPRSTVLAAGTPCQEISKSAARWGRHGLAGRRSGLWGEFARLIEEMAPPIVVWENVGGALCPIREKGVFVAPAPAMVVLSDLHDRGYDSWCTTSLASSVGAKHLRLRCFVVAWLRSGFELPAVDSPSHHRMRLDLDGEVWPAGPFERQRRSEPVRQIATSAEVRYHMERIEADGNSVVPQCGFAVGTAVGTAVAALIRLMRGEPLGLPRRSHARTPRAHGAELASSIVSMVRRQGSPRHLGSFADAAMAWTECVGRSGRSSSPFCGSLPGVVTSLGGELFAQRDAPSALRTALCAKSGACDGLDPVDGTEIDLWPTATARDWRSGRSSKETRDRNSRPLSEVAAPAGFLNPAWVDAHMGFGADYTLVDPGVPQRKRGSKLE